MAQLVFVSGATGYIAQHVIVQLLEEGYKVVGTVRSTEKGELLKKNLNNPNFTYEIVSDITAPGAFDEVLSKHSFDIVLHTASPVVFDFNPEDFEKVLITPAVEGTTNVLKSVQKHGPNVKKLIVTSSVASINNTTVPVLDETVHNPITWEEGKQNQLLAYRLSKTLAEKVLWDYVKENNPQYAVTTIHPVLVLGPQAFASSVKPVLNHSADVLNKLLAVKDKDTFRNENYNVVDVRDVARAHLVLITHDLKNERLILFASAANSQLLLSIANKHFPQAGFFKGVPLDDKPNPQFKINDAKSRKLLGFKYYDLEQTVVDSIKQILDAQR